MRLLLIVWHSWLISVDMAELHLQSIAGCSSSAWAVNVIRAIQWREGEIERLKHRSRTLKVLRYLHRRWAA